MIFTCPGKVLSYTSGQMILLVNGETQTLQLNGLIFNLIGKCHLEDYIVPKQSINTQCQILGQIVAYSLYGKILAWH